VNHCKILNKYLINLRINILIFLLIVSGNIYGQDSTRVAPKGDKAAALVQEVFKYGYGTGFRVLIDKATDSVLRFDWSFRKGGHGSFIGFNEAF